MNTLVSVFQRTIVSAVFVLALSTAVANTQSTSIWLEAECASAGSLWNKPADANASNSSYVVIQPGANSTSSAPTNSAGYIDFSFSVSQSGTYRVFARVLTPTADDDSWWVRVDGGSWVVWNNIAATSWTWAQFPNTFNLSAGSHTLTFAYREDGAQLDKINITTSTTAPTGAGSTASNLCSTGASVWLEAECGSLGSLWNTPSDGAASEGRYLTIQSGSNSASSAPTNSAGYANFSFSVGQSGTYRVFARVLTPTANDDSWWVRMDGGSWVNWNNIAATSWTWAQFPNTFSLSAGSHTLTFAYREDGAQLDKINITTSTTAPTGAGSTASNLCSTGATLSVAPSTVNVAAAANSADTFNITSNTSWTVTDNQSWLTVSPTSGSNNGTVTVTAQENTGASARTATVTVSATGVPSRTVTVTQSGGGGGGCNIPPMPSFASLPTNSFLPDPFTSMNGSRVTTRAQWACRRAEIAALAQEFEYGYKPNTPYSATTGSRSGNTLTVTVTDNGRTISFNASITYPSSGSAPYPAMIGVGGSNLNNSALSSMGVAVINFPNNEIAQQNGQSSRGVGKFYDMYGSGHSAGALMAWAWGVSRLIDALEKTPAANIDPARLGVTGCSRNGKGALTVGAFDERIKLTIPQESGSGGSGSWRVSDWMASRGQETQTLSQIVGENVWFRANFNQFSSAATKLPFDHHSIIGLVAPRAILIIENDILWLGPQSSWSAANAARLIWQAHGVIDMMGYSLTTGHTHCAFPSSQQSEVNAYVQRFLIGSSAGNTNVMRNDPGVTFDQSMWVNWTPEILVQIRRLYQSSQLLKPAE
jgi:(4-O-methyl)-D-glucuronate---lignin esterase